MGTVITGDVKRSTNAAFALRCKNCSISAMAEEAKDPLFASCKASKDLKHDWVAVNVESLKEPG